MWRRRQRGSPAREEEGCEGGGRVGRQNGAEAMWKEQRNQTDLGSFTYRNFGQDLLSASVSLTLTWNEIIPAMLFSLNGLLLLKVANPVPRGKKADTEHNCR